MVKQASKERGRLESECSNLQQVIQSQEDYFRKELEIKALKIKDMDARLHSVHEDKCRQAAELSSEITRVKQLSESQIRYMQMRLSELAQDPPPLNSNLALLTVLRREFQQVGQELIVIRQSVQDAAPPQCEPLEDFSKNVLDHLEQWNDRVRQVCKLASAQQTQLETQQAVLKKLKVVLDAKDELIADYKQHKCPQLQPHSSDSHNTLVSELLHTVSLQEQCLRQKANKLLALQSTVDNLHQTGARLGEANATLEQRLQHEQALTRAEQQLNIEGSERLS